jgi:hypothetical protein
MIGIWQACGTTPEAPLKVSRCILGADALAECPRRHRGGIHRAFRFDRSRCGMLLVPRSTKTQASRASSRRDFFAVHPR